MKYLISKSNNPYFNLATEEYLMNNYTDSFLFFYQNSPSVIVGKNQNTITEINFEYVAKNKIDIVRRMSGGGAVFHDFGNLNFAFILPKEEKYLFNFPLFTKPIVNVLRAQGVNASNSSRNDIQINDWKVSGNAQYIGENRFLHHGTIMLNVSKDHLIHALNPNPVKLTAKGIKSIKARVSNINSFLKEKLSVSDFTNLILDEIKKTNKMLEYNLNDNDLLEIWKLVNNKYQTTDFIYGKNRDFGFSNEYYLNGVGLVQFYFNLDQNRIVDLKVTGDFFAKRNINEFVEKLTNQKYEYQNIKKVVNEIKNINDYFLNIKHQDLLNLIMNLK